MRFVVLLLLCALPQCIGWLLYKKLTSVQKFLAHLVGLVVPPLMFFYWARWLAQPTPEQLADIRCGMPLMALSLYIILGTGLQFVFAACFQAYAGSRAGKQKLSDSQPSPEVILQ